MKITRHYLTMKGQKVHYRRCGSGPSLIMVHQSPRSSAEYEALMMEWGVHFTCIAPDTPGFGQSDPLPINDPDINDYADSLIAFIGALGLTKTAAYGFHSGGIILVTAQKCNPEIFTALAVGGYAIWTPAELALFGDQYLPEFLPTQFGEHLIWLWNRILEQSWFFPWFETAGDSRLSVAHDNATKVHNVIMDMLDAGNAYRAGYGAVLRAPRDIPAPDIVTPPVMITAYNGDPLQAHLERLGDMPKSWDAYPVATPADHQHVSLEFLRKHVGTKLREYHQDDDQGFAAIKTARFDGLIHWKGNLNSGKLHIHAPGQALEFLDLDNAVCIDLPGHGLSSGWTVDAPQEWQAWHDIIDAVSRQMGLPEITIPSAPSGDPELLFPELSPDRFGNYLTKAWQIVRARHFFAPWYTCDAANAIEFDPDAITADALAMEHRALIRASAAHAYAVALQNIGDQHGF
jgi:haloalkane dehalogenase